MIPSLLKSLTAKVLNAFYEVLNCILLKNNQSQTTIIPQYHQRKYWDANRYEYEPINDNPTTPSERQQRQYEHSIIFKSQYINSSDSNYYGQHNRNSSTTCSTSTLISTNDTRGGGIQYSSARSNHLMTTTNLRYYDMEATPKLIQTDPFLLSENKPPTFTTAPPTIVLPSNNKKKDIKTGVPPLKAHDQNKSKKRNETSRQRRLRRKRQKDKDIIIPSSPIVFKDDDIKYATMRTKAQEALMLKMTSRKKSDEAFKNGNKKLGRDLLAQSRVHNYEMIKLNQQAANHKYNEINKGRPSNIIDLHGLFVNEAREKVKAAIKKCNIEKKKEMILIVGNGNHSHDKVSKLKPAMMDYVESLKLHCVPNKPNSGCLLVQLGEPSLISL